MNTTNMRVEYTDVCISMTPCTMSIVCNMSSSEAVFLLWSTDHWLCKLSQKLPEGSKTVPPPELLTDKS